MNIKLIMIIISALAFLMVAGFGIWVAVTGPAKQPKQQEVKGAATSQEELIRQLEQNVFGDVIR